MRCSRRHGTIWLIMNQISLLSSFVIPVKGTTSVRVVCGRPFTNVTPSLSFAPKSLGRAVLYL